MKLLFILFLALFSNSAFPQTQKNSEDNFINLTNEIKGDQKISNDIKNDKLIDKKSEKNVLWLAKHFLSLYDTKVRIKTHTKQNFQEIEKWRLFLSKRHGR